MGEVRGPPGESVLFFHHVEAGSQEFTASMPLVLVVWVLVLMAVSRMFLRYFIVHNQS